MVRLKHHQNYRNESQFDQETNLWLLSTQNPRSASEFAAFSQDLWYNPEQWIRCLRSTVTATHPEGGPHFRKQVIPCAGQRGHSPTVPSPAGLPAGLAGSSPTRSGRGRASSVQRQPPWPGVRCYQGKEGGGRGIASPLRLLEAAWDGGCFSSACLPSSILPLFPPCKAAAAWDGRNLSRGAAVPGLSEHMAGVTMAAPCSLLPAPPFPPRSPGPGRGAPPLPFCVRTVSPLVRSPNTARGPSIADIFPPGRGATRTGKARAGAERRDGRGGARHAGKAPPLRKWAVERGTPRGGRDRFLSLPNPGARRRPASSRDWRARLNKEAARRGGAGAASTSF